MHPNKAKKSTCNAKGRTRCRRKGLIGDTCIKSVMQNGVARLEARNIKRLSILVAIHHLDGDISLASIDVVLSPNQWPLSKQAPSRIQLGQLLNNVELLDMKRPAYLPKASCQPYLQIFLKLRNLS